MRFFNIGGPCNPEDHYMLSATERLDAFDVHRVIEQKSRTTVEIATTPLGRTISLIRA